MLLTIFKILISIDISKFRFYGNVGKNIDKMLTSIKIYKNFIQNLNKICKLINKY